MKRKTLIEACCVAGLAVVAASIAWNRLQNSRDREMDAPPPTPTPRMRSILKDLDVGGAASHASVARQSPTPREPTAPVQQELETGFLVVDVREEDGSVPLEPVRLVNPLLEFQREVIDGRLTLESVPGPIVFYVETETRTSTVKTAQIEAGRSTELRFTLPLPEPEVATAGLQLQPDNGFYTIAAVVPGGPAEAAGLQSGDAVIAIGGVPVTELTQDEMVNALIGPEGSRVLLDVVIENERGQLQEVQVELILAP